jgi:hypothetical protein
MEAMTPSLIKVLAMTISEQRRGTEGQSDRQR